MSKMLNNLIIRDLEDYLGDAEGFVLVNPEGLDSGLTFDFRKKLRESGVTVKIINNRLAKRVIREKIGLNGDADANATFDELFRGQTAILTSGAEGSDGVIASAKAVSGWLKKNKKKVAIKGGLLEGQLLNQADVEGLADIPDTQALYGQIAGLFQAPVRNLATATQQIITKVVYALQAIKEKKEQEG